MTDVVQLRVHPASAKSARPVTVRELSATMHKIKVPIEALHMLAVDEAVVVPEDNAKYADNLIGLLNRYEAHRGMRYALRRAPDRRVLIVRFS